MMQVTQTKSAHKVFEKIAKGSLECDSIVLNGQDQVVVESNDQETNTMIPNPADEQIKALSTTISL